MRRGLQYNLGAARVDAKGTAWDYLAHPRAIPVQIMASHGWSFEVVKAPHADQADVVGNSGPAQRERRRVGAGSTQIRPSIKLTSAPASVCLSFLSLFGPRRAACAAEVPSSAASKASTLPSSAGPS